MSTIGLEGVQESITGLLKALGIDNWDKSGMKWRKGTRVWEGWVHERDAPATGIAPVTVIWNPRGSAGGPITLESSKKPKRRAFIRVHPSAFLQLWEQVIRLAKVQKPSVTVEDLRWEIGSIEITGPDASEALVGVLRPLGVLDQTNGSLTVEEMTWTKLGRCQPASLPANAVVVMSIIDPRLQFPPRTLPKAQLVADDPMLIQLLGNWPLDKTPHQAGIFDHKVRTKAKRNMPTQKTISRRKGQADPGDFPAVLPSDPPIPVLAFASRKHHYMEDAGTWTVLLPWACVSAVWKSLMYYPLSTGGTIRFGGINEKRQLAFETETPSFPVDCPGTKAGQQWEFEESNRRKAAWDRKPKSRRFNYESLDLGMVRKAKVGMVDVGTGSKGEIGVGWMCDWQRLFQESEPVAAEDVDMEDVAQDAAPAESQNAETGIPQPAGSTPSTAAVSATHKTVHRIPRSVAASSLLLGPNVKLPPNALATVRVAMLGRGRPSDCARIYRLPTNNVDLRKKWLALQPHEQRKKTQKKRAKIPPKPAADAPAAVQRSWLAATLLTEKPDLAEVDHPDVPDEEDLVGFVTTGNFSLRDGSGAGIGSVRMDRIRPEDGFQTSRGEAEERRQMYYCIVRNAGEAHGRLAEWHFV
jgi:ribonuclease P/MRP protein subunit POP1